MCYRPITLKTGSIVPCSRCPKCIARRVSAWSFRLLQQLNVSESAHFLTLTYDTKYVPINHSGQLCLQKRDLQLFFKRLRKASISNVLPIKYYAVGEYGCISKRPHYHCILFNAKLELIQPAWSLGHIYYGSVNGGSIGYCLKYMQKQKRLRNPNGIQKEFSLMSKGLGISYLSQPIANWHVADLVNRMYCNLLDGKKIAMPRYYKDKLYYDNERSAITEAFSQIAHEKQSEKISKQTLREFRAEQAAIDNAFEKMYMAAQKQKL